MRRILFSWMVAMAGCTGAAGGGSERVTLAGAVEKGPFVLGSAIAVSPVDELGSPTGLVFKTQTTNDLGEFRVDFAYQGLVSIEGSGFYYNEVSGALSTAPITLRALHRIERGGAQKAYVNLITHLAYDREKRLLADGMELPAAITQAEAELRTALGVGGSAFDPRKRGIEMNLLGGDDLANAYLFAVSAVAAQAAADAASGTMSIDAQLQELLANLAIDLSDDGKLQPNRATVLTEAQRRVQPDRVKTLLRARLDAVGSNAPVPDLERALDSDLDGVVNHDDNCVLAANPDQQPIQSVCRVVRSETSSGVETGSIGGTTAGDFDGDGVDDLIFVQGNGRMLRAAGRADGSFAPPVEIGKASSVGYIEVIAEDVDGDGRRDLLLFGYEGVILMAGRGDGSFESPLVLRGRIQGEYLWSMTVADFDGDGRLDVAGIIGDALTPGDVSVMLQKTPRSLSPLTPLGLPEGARVLQLAHGDFDGDGKADLLGVTGTEPSNKTGLEVLLSDGNGGFRPQPIVTPGVRVTRLVVGRFDDDGRDDVGVGDYQTGELRILAGGAGGALTALRSGSVPGTGSYRIDPMLAADLTGDGKSDLVLTDGEGILRILDGGTLTTAYQRASDPNVSVIALLPGRFNGGLARDLVTIESPTMGKSGDEYQLAALLIN